MKRTLIVLLLFADLLFANYFEEESKKEAKAMQEGFVLAITSMEKEYEIQGINETDIEFKEWMVVIDGSGKDYNDSRKYSVQLTGFRYADSVRLTNGWIVLASFKTEANAELLKERINERYLHKLPKNRQAYVHHNTNDMGFKKEKSLFSGIASLIERKIKENTKVLLIENASSDSVKNGKRKEQNEKSAPNKVNAKDKKSSDKTMKTFEDFIKETKKVEPKKMKKKDMNELTSSEKEISIPKKEKYLYSFILNKEETIFFTASIKNNELVEDSLNVGMMNRENSGNVYSSIDYYTGSKGTKKYYRILETDYFVQEEDITIVKKDKL